MYCCDFYKEKKNHFLHFRGFLCTHHLKKKFIQKTSNMEKRIISDAKGKYELNLFSSGAQLPEFIPQHVRDRVNKWISNYLLQPAYSCAGFTYFMVTGNDVPKVKVWNIFPSEDNTNCLLLRQSKDEKDGKFHFAFTVPEMNNMYVCFQFHSLKP